MESTRQDDQVQIQLRGGYGETEVVWAAPQGNGIYMILNTPVYAYNISFGTLVRAEMRPNGRKQAVEVVQPSGGVTVRIMAPKGERASDVVRSVVVPGATAEGLRLGPATMLDPRIAAIYVDDREGSVGQIIRYFDDLEQNGVLRWELADPDPTPPPSEGEDESRGNVELVHPSLR